MIGDPKVDNTGPRDRSLFSMQLFSLPPTALESDNRLGCGFLHDFI